MKSMFTIHAGEVLVGSYLEKTYKDYGIWLPSKDTGDDLLVTNKKHDRAVSLQVKFSQDFMGEGKGMISAPMLKSGGWWTLNYDKLKHSASDLWVMALYSFSSRKSDFVIIEPSQLLERYKRLGKTSGTIQSYIWVTKKDRCWETRGLGRADQHAIAADTFKDDVRDLTSFLNNWSPLQDKIGLS